MKGDWRFPIYEVLRHLHENLDRSVSLDEAADRAVYSPYHLHRRFRESVGETVGEMGRRLRLEKAAHLLVKSKLTVSEIAVECGFEAVESLSRRFRAAYGVSPTVYRRRTRPIMQLHSETGIHYRPEIAECIDIPLPLGDVEMSINIVQMKPMRVLSMRGTGDYWGMPELWARFMRYCEVHQLHRSNAWFFTLFHDHDESTPVDKKRYDVSMTVPDDFVLPSDEAFLQDFPGGEYVIYTFRGDNEGIGPAWNYFRESWFKENRFRLKPGLPSIEWYRTNPFSTPIEHLLTDLCDPIEPDESGDSKVEGTWPNS